VRLVRLTRGFLAGQALSDSRPPEGDGIGQMREFLDDHSGLFDPDQVPVLVAAFEGAWESAQTSAVIFDTDVNTEAAWLILAKHIIEAAKQGEHDEGRLRDGALAALAQSNLRSP